ncbi:Transposase DDE domain-containing protein [Legionella pneumophila subsp. pneumophila]|uniref:Transposase IS4-like domain-containing protein n=1 Tax=Legionella pneumophila (strain Lens) TaxID=297245 RepID=Q5WSN5_LEGPL|nr:hypothetical protein lpl2843 [Legionella pneumophila str. Lens]
MIFIEIPIFTEDVKELLADRGYDSNEIIEKAIKQGMDIVIPPRKNRKEQRLYDKAIYKLRHLVENAFPHLKRWRGLPQDMQKTPLLFLLQYKSGVLNYGEVNLTTLSSLSGSNF